MTAKLQAVPDVTTISPEAAHEEMTTGNPLILDVRPLDMYEAGHIHGAISIPLEELAVQAPVSLPAKDQRILVYCHIGVLSAAAVNLLINLGYTNVVSFGGIVNWPYGVVQ